MGLLDSLNGGGSSADDATPDYTGTTELTDEQKRALRESGQRNQAAIAALMAQTRSDMMNQMNASQQAALGPEYA